MKNNLLTIILCLGSVAFGFVLNSYWKHGDVLLKTEAAYEEYNQYAREGLANCRSMVYGKNDLDITLYQNLISSYLDNTIQTNHRSFEFIWQRYVELVNESNYAIETLKSPLDQSEGYREHTQNILNNARKFIELHADKFNTKS